MEVMLRAEAVGKSFRKAAVDGPRTFRHWVEGGFLKRRPRDRFWALRNVDFTVAKGEMIGVIGHNGSGKSTLLRVLGGVMQADEGRVTAAAPVHGLLELNTGMHPDLSGVHAIDWHPPSRQHKTLLALSCSPAIHGAKLPKPVHPTTRPSSRCSRGKTKSTRPDALAVI